MAHLSTSVILRLGGAPAIKINHLLAVVSLRCLVSGSIDKICLPSVRRMRSAGSVNSGSLRTRCTIARREDDVSSSLFFSAHPGRFNTNETFFMRVQSERERLIHLSAIICRKVIRIPMLSIVLH